MNREEHAVYFPTLRGPLKRRVWKRRATRARKEYRRLYVHACGCVVCDPETLRAIRETWGPVVRRDHHPE